MSTFVGKQNNVELCVAGLKYELKILLHFVFSKGMSEQTLAITMNTSHGACFRRIIMWTVTRGYRFGKN